MTDLPMAPPPGRGGDHQVQEFAWHCEQGMAAMAFVGVRVLTLGQILLEARLGALPLDWRVREHPVAVTGIPERFAADAAAAVALELTVMAVQPWEPGASGGEWRVALDAWYAAFVELGEYHQRQRRSWAPYVDVSPNDPSDVRGIADGFRESSEFQEAERSFSDSWAGLARVAEVSYRAGLAAGGEDSGWRAWFEDQYGEPPNSPDEGFFEQLPSYWTTRTTC